MIYILRANPSSPTVSLPNLRQRAKRAGYCIARDRYAQTYSLVDARLGIPLLGLDRVHLAAVAQAIEAVRRPAR